MLMCFKDIATPFKKEKFWQLCKIFSEIKTGFKDFSKKTVFDNVQLH